jgi:hypothetical protein
MDGVKDVVWSENVNVVGRKISIPSSIIDGILHKTFTKGKNT